MRRTIALSCNKHGYQRGSYCKECESESSSGIQINVYNSHDVETANGHLHVGSKRDERVLEKQHGIARYEEIKERAQDAKNRKPVYKLSPETKKLNNYIKQHGVSERLISKIPQYKNLRRPRIEIS